MKDYQTLFGLCDREVWFFGGAGYLGSQSVLLALSAGARVLCIDRGERAAEWIEREVPEEWRGRVTPATLDVSDIPAAVAFVREQRKHRGLPHGVVMLTYASSAKALDELSPEEFDCNNRVNLTAPFAIVRDLGNGMAAEGRGGSLVLFSSMYGAVAPDPGIYPPPMSPNPIDYGAGKAAIAQMARYFAVYWGKAGVRCNSIAPGPFPFPSQQEAVFTRELERKTPLGRIGRSDEIAGAVLYLLSDAASYVTGHHLAVDGGWTAW